jgi:hypothetical protein
MFIGREPELAQLKGLLDIKIAHMVIIKGRRRIGSIPAPEIYTPILRAVFISTI